MPDRENSTIIDEIFSTMIENTLRVKHNKPLRTHYQGEVTYQSNPTLFEQTRILDKNNKPTIEAMKHLNNYKKSGLWKD